MPAKPKQAWMAADWLEKTAECLRVLAHPVRLQIIECLDAGKYPVKEIAEHCRIPASQACEHLRHMKSCGLLESERDGRTVFYRIENQQVASLLQCLRKNCPAWEEARGIKENKS
jgi:DNA-binding transcriptional ArsR family regulator